MTRFQKYQKKTEKKQQQQDLINYKVMLETTTIKRTSFSNVTFFYSQMTYLVICDKAIIKTYKVTNTKHARPHLRP